MAANSHSVDLEASSTQFLSRADEAALDITGNMSFACWADFESVPVLDRFIIASKRGGGGNRGWRFAYVTDPDPALEIVISGDGTNEVTKTVLWTALTVTEYHVAFAYTAAAGECKFYVDGVQQGDTQTGLPTSIFNNSNAFLIGAQGAGSQNFDGLLDEAVLTSDVMTSTEIGFLQAGWLATDKVDNIVGYWKFNNDLTDASGNSLTLTNNGDATFSTTVPFANYAVAAVASAVVPMTTNSKFWGG